MIALRRSPNAGDFHGSDFQGSADLVHDQGGQSFAFNFLREDDQRPTLARNAFQNGYEVAHCRNLLFVNEDQGIFEYSFHSIGIGDEVGRKVAAVKLHSFDEFQVRFHRLGFFDRNDAILADLFHGFRDETPDISVTVRRNRRYLFLFFLALDGLEIFFSSSTTVSTALVDATLQIHRIRAPEVTFLIPSR
jgi:hypothetical protein